MVRKKKEVEIEKSYLNIGTFDCWKCKKDMKISWITTQGTYYGPEKFTDDQIAKARNNGVIIKQVTSKMLSGEKYLANICPHCGTFIGQNFIDNYLYSENYRQEIDVPVC